MTLNSFFRPVFRMLIVLFTMMGLSGAALALDAQFRFETRYNGKAQIVLLGVPVSQVSQALETRNGRRMIPEYMSTYVDYKKQSFMNLVLIEDDRRGWGFEWGRNYAGIEAYFVKKRDEGYCATNLGTYLLDGEVRYAMVLKTGEDCAKQSLYGMRGSDEVNEVVRKDFDRDYRLIAVSSFGEGNRLFGAVLTQSPKVATSYDIWHKLDKLPGRNATLSTPKNGYTRLLKDLSIVHDGTQWRYSASWRDRKGTDFGAQLWDASKNTYSNSDLRNLIANNGLRIRSVAGYVSDGEQHTFRLMTIK